MRRAWALLRNSVREQNCLQLSYEAALQQAIQFTTENNGTVETLDDGVTRLTLSDFQVDCFRPYSDIDRFYFEY